MADGGSNEGLRSHEDEADVAEGDLGAEHDVEQHRHGEGVVGEDHVDEGALSQHRDLELCGVTHTVAALDESISWETTKAYNKFNILA